MIVITSLDETKNIFFQRVSWFNITPSIIRFLVDWPKMINNCNVWSLNCCKQKILSRALYLKSGGDLYFYSWNIYLANCTFFDEKYISERGLFFNLPVSILYKFLESEISPGNVIIMLTHQILTISFISCSWKCFLYKNPARLEVGATI